MITRADRLDAILQAAVEAYERGEGGRTRPLLHIRVGGGKEGVQHAGWPPYGPPVSREDLLDLEDQGWVRITEQPNSWAFAPTAEGSTRVEELKRRRLRPHLESFDSSWAAIRPVLRAAVEAWEAAGAHEDGVDTVNIARQLEWGHTDPGLARALELLAQDGWVELEYEMGTATPLTATPQAKALQALRAWPGQLDADALAERLLTAIDQTMDATKDQQERGRLQKLRDFAIDLGANTTAEIAAKMAAGQV